MNADTKVAILTYNKAAFFELGCAVELFGLSRPEYPCWYSSEVVSFEQGALELAAGLQIKVRTVKDLKAYDILVVPSWPVQFSNSDRALPDKAALSALKHFAASGKRLLSFCSGAFLLAELGLLDGRKATTHWRYAELFKARFPSVHYVDDVLYVYDGKIGCSAGSAAALDLGIEIIRRDFGYKIANQVARRLVLSAHRQGGQSQFVETPVLQSPGQFASALDWALAHLSEAIDVNSMADRANMSRRTFDRKFRSSLNLSPKEWLTVQRLNLAKELLEKDTVNIEKVASLCGFESAITFRHHFRKKLGVSPGQYRKQFNKIRA